VLWGDRAIIQEPNRALSVVNIGGIWPAFEILRDRPAAGIGFLPTWSGFQIMESSGDRYEYNVRDRTFTTQTLGLPEVQIDDFYLRAGSEVYPNYEGYGDLIGIHVISDEVKIGVPLPFALFRLVDRRTSVAS
jgi:hypothetical protein